jgi:ATP adenylyltransferase/5',5'''-P-1,P-4-tetraphosphate phosphorylase II
LRKILTWRKKILEDARKEKQEEAWVYFIPCLISKFSRKKAAAEAPPDLEVEEQKELEEIDELIRNASAAEKAKLKR